MGAFTAQTTSTLLITLVAAGFALTGTLLLVLFWLVCSADRVLKRAVVLRTVAGRSVDPEHQQTATIPFPRAENLFSRPSAVRDDAAPTRAPPDPSISAGPGSSGSAAAEDQESSSLAGA
jgi:hypothetical protein